jgi:hypothetical protein
VTTAEFPPATAAQIEQLKNAASSVSRGDFQRAAGILEELLGEIETPAEPTKDVN